MDAGELLQYGPTAEVFHQPQSIRVARASSDPPMNLMAAEAVAGGAAALLVPSNCPRGHSPSHVELDRVWAIAQEAGVAIGLVLAVLAALGVAYGSARIHAANVSQVPAFRFNNPWINPQNR